MFHKHAPVHDGLSETFREQECIAVSRPHATSIAEARNVPGDFKPVALAVAIVLIVPKIAPTCGDGSPQRPSPFLVGGEFTALKIRPFDVQIASLTIAKSGF